MGQAAADAVERWLETTGQMARIKLDGADLERPPPQINVARVGDRWHGVSAIFSWSVARRMEPDWTRQAKEAKLQETASRQMTSQRAAGCRRNIGFDLKSDPARPRKTGRKPLVPRWQNHAGQEMIEQKMVGQKTTRQKPPDPKQAGVASSEMA